MEQRTPEWFAERCGRVTASRVEDVIAKTKSGPSASRVNYAAQLIAERLTGTVEASFTNDAMQWGTDTEPMAREAYEFTFGVMVDEIGFVRHGSLFAGASPDGMVSDDGLIEIKCPNTATQIDTLLGASVPGKYVTQMQWQMACTGRAWCDFVSFDPRLPLHLRLFVRRVPRDAAMIADLEREVAAFLSEIDTKVVALEALQKAS